MAPDLLTPAEAALLLKPSSFSGGKCLQAALMTLLARRHVELGEAEGIFKQKTLRVRESEGDALPAHLSAVKHALMAEASYRELKASDVVRALQRAFGSDYRRYVHERLAPGLIRHGLLRREDRKFLGLIPYVKYLLTAEGQERADRIAAVVDELGDIKRILRDDPARARQLAQAAGILLVLSPAARAEAGKIKAIMQSNSDGGVAVFDSNSGDDERSSGWEIGVDVGDFSFATDAFDLLDGIGAAGDFIGGDGGGDGGDGGDGGGGGD